MRKLIFHNTLFHSEYSIFRKKSLIGLNRLSPLMINKFQKRSLTQFRDFTFLASNETIQQFSWTTMFCLFFGVPLGMYLYKVWYVSWCDSFKKLKSKELYFLFNSVLR
jgi:hypothetical protein